MANLLDIYQEVGTRIRISDSIYLTLKKAIIFGLMLPQEKIDEKLLAEELTVSQNSLREAIKLLEADHYISFVKGKGYTVENISLEDLMKINEFLCILSIASAEIVSPADSTTAIILLESLNKEFETTNYELDKKFHTTLAFCTKNNEILNAIRDLYDRMLWGMNVLCIKDISSDILEEHKNITQHLIHDRSITSEKISEIMTRHFNLHLENMQCEL